MKKALLGMLLALVVLGGLAGLSGREMANEELQAIKAQWAELQARPSTQRGPAEVADLRDKAEELATRYPGRDEFQVWERIIERSTRDWRAPGPHAS